MTNDLATQVKTDLDRFCAAWNTNDGAALGGFFVEEGALVNPFGERAEGRGSVAAMYTTNFGGILRNTSTVYRLTEVRAVGGDHAFTDGEQTIFAPDGSVVMKLHLAALLRNEGGAWRFLDARPYAPSTRPA